MNPIKVLIVDDSSTMRALIASTLRANLDIVVVGEAADPLEAREAIKALNPDAITLDVEMPNMNGIDFLERLMRLRPTPVVMVSTLTTRSADVTIRALEIGAFDCVAKPSIHDQETLSELAGKIRQAVHSRKHLPSAHRAMAAPAPKPSNYEWDGRLVAIGASTGGVEALIEVISQFPENCPATVITQHMPASFTKSFAERLNRLCAATVLEASEGEVLRQGRILLAPGGERHMEISGRGELFCRLREGDKIKGHRPSVDALFQSIAKAGAASVGVILTGMGGDGAQGLLSMRQAGAQTIGQDERSSVVYGMPKVAFELGAVGKQLPLSKIGQEVLRVTNKTRTIGRV